MSRLYYILGNRKYSIQNEVFLFPYQLTGEAKNNVTLEEQFLSYHQTSKLCCQHICSKLLYTEALNYFKSQNSTSRS